MVVCWGLEQLEEFNMKVVDLFGMEDDWVVDLVDLVDDSEELVEVNGLLLVLHPPKQEVGFE